MLSGGAGASHLRLTDPSAPVRVTTIDGFYSEYWAVRPNYARLSSKWLYYYSPSDISAQMRKRFIDGRRVITS